MSSYAYYRDDQQRFRVQSGMRIETTEKGQRLFADRDPAYGSFYFEPEQTDHRSSRIIIENRGKEKMVTRRESLTRFFRILIAVLLLVLGLEVSFHLFVAPRLLIENVKIKLEKGINLTNREILQIAGIHSKDYYFQVNEGLIIDRLEAHPLIRRAQVKKIFPDTLNISLHGRKPLGVSLVTLGGITVPVVFDEEGVVFKIGQSVTDYNLPVISGITFDTIRLGMTLPAPITGFLRDLRELEKTAPGLYALISEVKFIKKNDTDFETLLYPSRHTLRVRLGSSIDKALLSNIILVLDVVTQQGLAGTLSEIDFRSPEVVYRVRGE